MLKKIIKIENIKQWQHKGGLDQSFVKLNLIYGRNGSGKSTLCKLFEAINNNDKVAIESQRPIETSGKQELRFLMEDQTVSLSSLKCSSKFQIFNQAFIDNNLYISKGTDKSQLVNYYEFSLGMVSVAHEKEIERLKSDNNVLTSKITPLSNKITGRFSNKNIVKIKGIKVFKNENSELEKLQEQLQDIKSIEHFRKRRKLVSLSIDKPELKTGVFVTTIENLSKESEDKISKHIELNLKEQDSYWLETGKDLVTDSDNCPFCAQPLSTSPIFHLYQEFMNEAYLNASNDFELEGDKFELSVRDIGVKLEALEERVKSNSDIIREWSDRIDSIDLTHDFKALDRFSTNLVLECVRLINLKKKDLLATIDLTKFNKIFNEIFSKINFDAYNQYLSIFNESIDHFLNGLGTETSQSIQTKIDNIQESQLRHSDEVVNDLADLKELEGDKKTNTKTIKDLREKINDEQEESIGNHKDAINSLLKNFHSMVRLSELKKDNKGGKGASRVTYAIAFIDNELSILSNNEHIFEHVLSLGDRSALALAFFLSRFSKDNDDRSIIVLDDPMSSLDSYRRDATIIEIGKLIDSNYQTFVLSHDPFFLSDLYKHSILSKYTNCFEIEASYKDLNPLDANSAQYISSKLVDRENYDSYVIHSYHKEYNKLFEFVADGNEKQKVEIARSIRPILEAYLRFLYPKQFIKGYWLGDMITKIRQETNESSPYYDKHNRFSSIERINDFSKNYHHADGFDTKIQDLDYQTVKSYAKETLCFITGV
ncbi:AAA family ATPase [Pseudoalteromonas sp. SWYJ118]|uniref:AAA family ATPase n=1 Tax=Pseudoalteromonas sp. SWYJ118 TaxID=2792062 RepID=UPI0018CF599C|nr:AAA family ATPase [Pseudoalteromonas sp. SWYJ118]